MKKTFTLLASVIFFFSAKAQSFEIGGRYLAESNWFFNSNVTNGPNSASNIDENYAAIYSYSYGVHLAYNITDHVSLESNVLWATLAQSYNGSFGSSGFLPDGEPYLDGETYKSTTTVHTMQIPVMFRFLSGNGAYFGLGPEIDLVSSANYSASYKGGPVESEGGDVSSAFAKSYFCAVLSFGNNIRLSHSLFFNINLRFSYDITDMKGVDALGQDLSNSALYSGVTPFYAKYQATNAVSASFGVGLIYRIGHDF